MNLWSVGPWQSWVHVPVCVCAWSVVWTSMYLHVWHGILGLGVSGGSWSRVCVFVCVHACTHTLLCIFLCSHFLPCACVSISVCWVCFWVFCRQGLCSCRAVSLLASISGSITKCAFVCLCDSVSALCLFLTSVSLCFYFVTSFVNVHIYVCVNRVESAGLPEPRWCGDYVCVAGCFLLSVCESECPCLSLCCFDSRGMCLSICIVLVHGFCWTSYRFRVSLYKWKRGCSVVSDSLWPPWILAYQVSPFMGFPRQENWGGLPFPSPGDLPDPGIKPGSPTL